MVTASAAGLALHQHVIPLVSSYNDQAGNTQVSLTRLVNVGDGPTKNGSIMCLLRPPKMWRPFVIVYWNLTMSQPSHICHSIWDLSSFPFSTVFRGTIRDKWDILADGHNETVANYLLICNNLIAELVCPTNLADQRHYLETSKRPYKLNCAALSARLETINKMMLLFPGAGGNPPMQAIDVKNLYYQMMPSEWQRVFLNSGQVITDPNYTLISLQCFMTLQEEQNQADVAQRRQLQQRNPCSRGGRSRRSPNRRRAPGSAGSPSTRYQASGAVPPVPPAASPAQGGIPVPFRGFACPPYHGQCSYGRGQPYHPYSRAPVPGGGHGCGRHGSDMYQVEMDALPPVASDPCRPEGSPPDDLHFADGDYDHNAALAALELERWVTGYSNDSGTPQESEYPPGSIYEYAPDSYYEENQDQDYYYGDEE